MLPARLWGDLLAMVRPLGSKATASVIDRTQPLNPIAVASVMYWAVAHIAVCPCLPQESLSLSHAVTVVLSQLFQARLTATAADPLASQYTVTEPAGLADGYDSSGTEH